MDVAGNVGAVNAANLALAANVAISSLALGRLGGRQAAPNSLQWSHLVAINQDTGVNALTFDDGFDLLLDITGVTGTISTSNFV